MKIKIKHRWTGEILFALEIGSLKMAVEAAVKEKANLRGADLGWADLGRANLVGADLGGADLGRADLGWANLGRADLGWANLGRADLGWANLVGANLVGANLVGANLVGANFDIQPADDEQAVKNLDKVREIILDNHGRLEMGHWHGNEEWFGRTCAEETLCGTTHCLAGWLQVCSTDKSVRKLSPKLAGTLEAPVATSMFMASNSECLEWLKERKYAKDAA